MNWFKKEILQVPIPKFRVIQKTVKVKIRTQEVIIRMANGTDRFVRLISKSPNRVTALIDLITGQEINAREGDNFKFKGWVDLEIPTVSYDPERIVHSGKGYIFTYKDNEGIHHQIHSEEVKEVVHNIPVDMKDTYDVTINVLEEIK